MAQIKPFRFHLTPVSKTDNEIVAGLFEFLPANGIKESFHLAIRKALQQYLPDIRYYLEGLETLSFQDFFSHLSSPCTVGVINLEPFKEKAFIEIDSFLSYMMIEKLLGGKGEDWGELHPLTETEQGVMEFLLLKVLSQIHKLCGEKAKLHFRLEQMILEPAHVRSLQKEGLPLVCLKIHIALFSRSGFVKIYLPHPWILEGFLKEIPGDKKSPLHKEMKESLVKFEDLSMQLWGSLGEATVSSADVKSLEEGDVVLFDETGLVKKQEQWQGSVKLVAGKGESGGLKASWDGFKEGGLCHLSGGLSGGKSYG